MLRRRPLTATQICTLPEQAPRAAAFYEPPRAAFLEPLRGEEPQDIRLTEDRDTAAAA
jgi:hypothetical protein